ncbi:PAS domain S-box-containing protein [Collimonas sp. OK307]|uniref:PAS domain-containing sensor histidine kinase n=1 Tax=Collimonas sp. OK307 TaxID=1801620 RepID=UPI0008E723A2|nr:PAS domain-containing protein [Collimonas sp. OK307]SFI41309.1 PAS domain S-box-containing protein [Collimonas sp. OK307]
MIEDSDQARLGNPLDQDLLKARALESLAATQTYVSRSTIAAVAVSVLLMLISALVLIAAVFPVILPNSLSFPLQVSLPFPTLQLPLWGTNTAAGFLLATCSLLLQCLVVGPQKAFKFFAQILAVLLLMLAIAALLHEVLGSAGWLDVFLTALTPHPGQRYPDGLHPMAAIGFVFCGLALLLLDHRTRHDRHVAEYLAISLIFLSAIPLLGYLYNVAAMTKMVYATGIPWLAAVAFFLFGMALLMSRPRQRLMAIITRHAPGGQMLRRSVPQMLILLVALHWLADWGARQGFYDRTSVPPLLTLIDSVLVVFIFWRAAGQVDREYGARVQSAAELAEATALLIAVSDNTNDPIFVKDRQGRLMFANPAYLRRLGLEWQDARYRRSAELFQRKEDAERIDQDDARIMNGKVSETLEQTVQTPNDMVTFQTTKAPWFDQQGRVMGVVGIATDISERKRAEDSLRQRESELERTIAQRTALLRELANHMETIREEEKRAIARELHDNMGASLTALSMHLAGVYKVLPDNEQWQNRQAQMQALLSSLVATTRRIQTELRPNMLDLFGLKAAILEQLEDFGQRTGIVCKSSLPDEDIAVDHKVDIAVYRMLQEILNNVSKHAQASQVEVILDIDEDRLALTVRDNGVGMSQQRFENTVTHGLRGLHERATYLGGSVHFKAAEGKGTTVVIELPMLEQAPPAPADQPGT